MRDSILFYLNGQRLELRGGDVFLPLSRFLRERRGLTGLKVVCGEGACGACTVLVGESLGTFVHQDPTRLTYKAINSCLHPVFQMHGRHVVTVEGLQTPDGTLSAIQTAMVEKHGSQCGYCTPGIVMSLTGVFEESAHSPSPPNKWAIANTLAGNLCRCTGYLPIVEAAETVDSARYQSLETFYPSVQMVRDLAAAVSESVTISEGTASEQRSLLIAESLELALAYRAAKPGCQIVAGGTGFAGAERIADLTGPILCLGRIPELLGILVDHEHGDRIGSLLTWSDFTDIMDHNTPELGDYLRLFGSSQIRNMGTVGGSVAHAEGNADILPLLLVQAATVHLASITGTRTLPIGDFLVETCVPTELLTGISLPAPTADETLCLYKVRRRQAFDRSVFCAAIVTRRDEDGTIAEARIACGGIGPTPMRLPETEAFLADAPFTEETMQAAGTIAAAEISPVDDAYASAEYRRQLARNLLLRHFWDVVESNDFSRVTA